MNIVLTGFMGTGKSAAGRVLARELGLKLVDIDAMVVEQAGISVTGIFEKFGEARFRELESTAIKKVISTMNDCVVSTGGGAVVSSENRDALKKWGKIICLNASVETILERVGRRDDRPLLSSGDRKESIEKLLEERAVCYGDSDFTIDTSGMEVVDIVTKIKSLLRV